MFSCKSIVRLLVLASIMSCGTLAGEEANAPAVPPSNNSTSAAAPVVITSKSYKTPPIVPAALPATITTTTSSRKPVVVPVVTDQQGAANTVEEPASDEETIEPSSKTNKDHDGNSTYIHSIHLFTRAFSHGTKSEVLDPINATSLKKSRFQQSNPTYVLVHGYLARASMPWILSVKTKLLQMSDSNVITIDWAAGADESDLTAYNLTDYLLVAGRVEPVGNGIAVLFTALQAAKGFNYTSVHMIGHCLGAHVAGFTGKQAHTDTLIGRITGLDPAGYAFNNTMDPARLARSDAFYVDVIHTNGCQDRHIAWPLCLGIVHDVGNTDFWPNGGEYQPHCDKKRGHHHGLGHGAVGCDHDTSYNYFLESLDYDTSTTKFLSRPAKNYWHYNHDNLDCGPVPQYMGYLANPLTTGDYYLNTTSSLPYAVADPACPSGNSPPHPPTPPGPPHHSSLTIVAAILLSVVALVTVAVPLTVYFRRRVLLQQEHRRLVTDDDDDDGSDSEVSPGVMAAVARRLAEITNRSQQLPANV